MNYSKAYFWGALLAVGLTLNGCNFGKNTHDVTTLAGELSGTNEVPAIKSQASGSVLTNLDYETNKFSWKIIYRGLSGPVIAAHFHGPAKIGENAAPVIAISGSLASPISGSSILTKEQVAELGNGQWYVNLHTNVNPNGEIRAQLVNQR